MRPLPADIVILLCVQCVHKHEHRPGVSAAKSNVLRPKSRPDAYAHAHSWATKLWAKSLRPTARLTLQNAFERTHLKEGALLWHALTFKHTHTREQQKKHGSNFSLVKISSRGKTARNATSQLIFILIPPTESRLSDEMQITPAEKGCVHTLCMRTNERAQNPR